MFLALKSVSSLNWRDGFCVYVGYVTFATDARCILYCVEKFCKVPVVPNVFHQAALFRLCSCGWNVGHAC